MLIDIAAMIRGIIEGVLKMYTPEGFWSQSAPKRGWVTELEVDREADKVKVVIECSIGEAQWWAMLNARPCMDELLDLEDGRDLLFADKIPDNPND